MKTILRTLVVVVSLVLVSGLSVFGADTFSVNVSVSPEGSGVVNFNPPSGDNVYEKGTKITLEAIPMEGQAFSHWAGDLKSDKNPLEWKVKKETNITAVFVPNLLKNGSFEVSGSDWQYTSVTRKLYGSYDTTDVKAGKQSAKISLPDPDDGRFRQWVSLKPNTYYRLSGWIKTEKVNSGYQSVKAGATLTVEFDGRAFPQVCSSPIFGTRDWKKVSFRFSSTKYERCYIQARVGYYSGNTTGTAWFDGLELIEVVKH